MYSDRDGTASKESQAAYKRRVRLLRLATSVFLSVGFGAAVVGGEYETLTSRWVPSIAPGPHLRDVHLFLWPLFLVFNLCSYRTAHPVSVYRSAVVGTLVSCALIVSLLSSITNDIGKPHSNVFSQLSCVALIFVAQAGIPRRPQLFTPKGHGVDAEGSSSLLGLFSLFWCLPALGIASKSDDLDTMPALNHEAQSASQQIITVASPEPYLWNRVFTERFSRFVKQWIIVFLRAIFTMGPSYCLQGLLKCLEGPGHVTAEAWVWFFGMVASSIGEAVANNYIAWMQQSEIALPVRAQLISSLFRKLLRKKEAKGDNNSSKQASQTPNIINLVSRDSWGLSFYAAIAYLIPSRLFKFFASASFLYRLLGWRSTVAGVLATGFCFSIHQFTTTKSIAARRKKRSSHDRTTTVLKEMLSSLRDIKFSASERRWEAYVDSLRETELRDIQSVRCAAAFRGIWDTTAPFVVIIAALSTYIYTGGQVTPSVIFPMMSSLAVLQDSLSFIPTALNDYFGSFDTARRLDKYLATAEQPAILDLGASKCVCFEKATITWPSDETHEAKSDPKGESGSSRFSLKNVNIAFPPGELSVISGKTGSGKSLLLAGILGEVELLEGRIKAPIDNGISAAYVAQVPWLQSGTIEENILFGSPMNRMKYDQVISACALLIDFRALRDGDQTKIGLRGVKLSGGQRTRIGFARALYSSAKTLVLDDIFLSLDTHVAKEILGALTGDLCTGRTRILVTHHVSLCLPATKYLVHLENNTVSFAGTPDALAANIQPIELSQTSETVTRAMSASDGNATPETTADNAAKTGQSKQPAIMAATPYKSYFKAAGGVFFTALYIFWIVVGWSLNALAPYLLGQIKSNGPRPNASLDAAGPQMTKTSLSHNISLYLSSVILLIAIKTLSKLHMNAAALRATRYLFRSLISNVLRMPLLWLDSTPLGSLLKVFTTDSARVDESPLFYIAAFADGALNIVTVIGLGFYASKYTGIATVLLLIWCKALISRFNKALPMVRAADKGPMADILEHVTTTQAGISTIRAFGATDQCLTTLHRHLDAFSTQQRGSCIFYRWLALQMSLAGILFAAMTGAFILSSGSTGSVSRVGLSLTFAMQLTHTIGDAWHKFDALQESMNAVSLVIGYTELARENQDGDEVPAEWPSKGEIDVRQLEVCYAATLPPALKDVSFRLAPGERVGVVGRTGSGKSTLTLSLLRLLHAQEGEIHIDGVDISTVKVAVLRSRLGFIPQSPNVFAGTVRSNLDYFGKLSDDRITEALRQVQLLDEGGEGPGRFTVDSQIAAGGGNLSQGQRQLLCLARIILKNPKIIILDEATSAVDGETDTVIQEVIRKKFKGTLIVVAHRLETVVSLDRILVMKDGEVVENGSPLELLSANGTFCNLMEQSQECESLRKMILGIGLGE